MMMKPPSLKKTMIPTCFFEPQNCRILNQEDIRQRMEEDISDVSRVLSLSKDEATILLRYFNWSVSKVNDVWFVDEFEIREKLGLLEKPVVVHQDDSVIVVCGTCFESFSYDGICSAACGHPYCRECWASYITTSINNDSLRCLSLRCPEPSCKASVGQDMIDSLVSEEDRKKYSEFLVKSYIEDNWSTKWCPGPGCEYVIEFFNWEGSFDEGHRPLDCETVKKWVLKNTSESENMNYILAYCKPCPNYFGSRSKKIEMAKQSLEKYTLYFERWDVNKKSIVKAIADFQKVKNEKFKQLSKNLDISEACFDFITKAWLQIVECRGILEWSYAYRYYLPDNGPAKKQFFEFLQGEAESWLEKLHNCVERELQPFLYCENQLKHFDDYRRNLIQLAIVTENYFEKLVKALENGLSDVHKASSSSSKDMFEDDYWFCDCCTYANPFSVNKCQMCTPDDYEGA
ncbi:hypothetical protein P3X46_002191 [Hevea brasiliensis]|uniref:RBR-type E3 ubiquitin transferase n=1 Tax=Hevea brasiliensis TaxID=3981 RepID=A0ABQ9N3A5_HEVBR|nr:hypothetical protein P3X46_002191 [Hevea brasiliensis]